MSNILKQKITEIHSAIEDFTMEANERILLLNALDNEYKPAQMVIEMMSNRQLKTSDVIIMASDVFKQSKTDIGSQLIIALCDYYDSIYKGLSKGGYEDWNPIFILEDKKENDFEKFIRIAQDFYDRFETAFDKLVFFILPIDIDDDDYFLSWIDEALKALDMPRIRFGFIENIHDIDYTSLLEKYEGKYSLYEFEGKTIDIMLEALENPDIPDDDTKALQKHLVSMMKYQADGDIDEVVRQAHLGDKVALRNGWKEQRVIVYTALFSALLGAERHEDAEKYAQKALDIAQDITEEELFVRDKIETTAHMSVATIPLINKDYQKAAFHYQKAAELSEKAKDNLIAFEGWRMSSACYGKDKNEEKAWFAGKKAIEIAAFLPKNIREEGTVPHLAKSLRPIAQKNKRNWDYFSEKIEEFLGEDWEDIIKDAKVI